ncbi:MAG: hypothetical protein ABI220_03110 [Candidatus Saccharimonadales bacterium]
MAKVNKKKIVKKPIETDGVFVLKLVLYVILGSLWVKISRNGSNLSFPIPIGLLVGLFFTTYEHFRVNRKIEYAVLLVATLFGFIAPFGLFISF